MSKNINRRWALNLWASPPPLPWNFIAQKMCKARRPKQLPLLLQYYFDRCPVLHALRVKALFDVVDTFSKQGAAMQKTYFHSFACDLFRAEGVPPPGRTH